MGYGAMKLAGPGVFGPPRDREQAMAVLREAVASGVGFTPLQSNELSAIAAEIGATPMQVALAWLLHRSPNILLIPGTWSLEHLRENLAAAELELSEDVLERLDAIGARGPA
jgi:aryl-alcohol dehydrogenase-like predicted oxidoreductase